MGTMQLIVTLIFVLGISCSAKGENKGVSDSTKSTGSTGSTYYGYRYPYYRGSVNAQPHGFRYPAYGRWGHGLGGYRNYGFRNPISSSASHVSQTAHYPAGYNGWGGYSQHYPGNTMTKPSYRPTELNLGGIYRGQGAQVSQSPVQYVGYTIGKPIVSSYGVFYPRIFSASQIPTRGVSGQGGLGRFLASYPSGSSVNTVPRGNSHQSMYGGLDLGFGFSQSVPRMARPVVDPYGGYGAQYHGGATASTPQRGIYYPIGLRFGNVSRGYNFYYPTALSASHATQGSSYPMGSGHRNQQVYRQLGLGVESTYSGYNSYYPTASSVSQTTQNAPNPVGWKLQHLPVFVPVHIGNSYGGYGSHYPTKPSVSHITGTTHYPASWALGNQQGGYGGYGHRYGGYGLQHSIGSSLRPMSYGIGRPLGYGIWFLGYGTPYPLGQYVSPASHGLHNPSAYGRWGLSGLSRGYGTYLPTGYSIGNLSHGSQSSLGYGGYGARLPVNTHYQI